MTACFSLANCPMFCPKTERCVSSSVLPPIVVLALNLFLLAVPSQAAEIEKISFESSNVGNFGTPAATGWQFDSLNVITSIGSVNSNRPNFINGSNQEALKINPYTAPGGLLWTGNRTNQGAFWNRSMDTSAGPVETIDAGEVFYVEMEHFSDLNRNGAKFKTQVFLGPLGDGDPTVGGILNDAFDSTVGSMDATWTWGEPHAGHGSVASGIFVSNTGAEFSNTRYGAPPSPAEMGVNYTSRLVLRQGVDASTPFAGTEMEISEALGNFNGGDATNATDPDWGGNPTEITGITVDKATISVSRQSTVQGTAIADNEGLEAVTPWLDINQIDPNQADSIYNAEIGIKYLRFGTAEKTDVNLDGTTDAADLAIVQANQNKFGTLEADLDTDNDVDGADFLLWQQGGSSDPLSAEDLAKWQAEFGSSTFGRATFFDGDIDNDLDVDANDLAFFAPLSLTTLATVPEPSTFLLLVLGALVLYSLIENKFRCPSS